MKEQIEKAKGFICFYLSLPLFVLMVLVSGVGVLGNEASTPQDINTINHVSQKETSNSTTDKIELELSEEKGFAIVARDLSKDYNILNSTNKTVNEEKLLSNPLPYAYKSDVPLVLVIHTHATECYADVTESFPTADENGRYGYYNESSATRSEEKSKNMIAIGEAFCEVLAEEGIGVIQCRTLNDKDDYNNAYSNSRERIKEYIAKYPSIKYIIDIHRDSLEGTNKNKTKTLASEIEGSAQVMLVNGVSFEGWENNLALALKYKKAMDENYPSLSRPIYLRDAKYNLDITKGSLLLEVGTCANTFDEAEKAARLAARCFALVIKQGS